MILELIYREGILVKENFLKETLMRDELRNDSFEKTFPELINMIDGSI